MKSYQNLALLQNLYRLKALGYNYCDPIIINQRNDSAQLPDSLDELHSTILNCHLCDLSKSRKQPLVGSGSASARVMFIDSTVSIASDEKGEYFVAQSGKMLENMIEKVLDLRVDEIYITHLLKCQSAQNHSPSDSEYGSCKAYYLKQIELIDPDIIIAIGSEAYYQISGDDSDFEEVRAKAISFGKRTLFTIYHPQHLLQNRSLRPKAFEDLKNIKAQL